ncbi:hypothetical protein N7G274_009925 [Stereocaulon virgatum]|uniref:Uncharacterized protein n=1 Tax=Stereocaulon virgatum TaxID=373712 RepID=A0ABR3ZXF5_9LECA
MVTTRLVTRNLLEYAIPTVLQAKTFPDKLSLRTYGMVGYHKLLLRTLYTASTKAEKEPLVIAGVVNTKRTESHYVSFDAVRTQPYNLGILPAFQVSRQDIPHFQTTSSPRLDIRLFKPLN